MTEPIQDKRIVDLTEQGGLVSGDQFVLDNVGLVEARRIDQANLVIAISDQVKAISSLRLVQDPPISEDWRPSIYEVIGLNVPDGGGASSVSFEIDISPYITDAVKGVWLLVFVEHFSGPGTLSARISPLNVFPTGVIVAGSLQGSFVINTTFTALNNSIDKRFYIRFSSSGGASVANAEINLLAAL